MQREAMQVVIRRAEMARQRHVTTFLKKQVYYRFKFWHPNNLLKNGQDSYWHTGPKHNSFTRLQFHALFNL